MPEATDITRRKPIIGLKTEDLDDLSTLVLSVDELSEGMLSARTNPAASTSRRTASPSTCRSTTPLTSGWSPTPSRGT